MGNLLEKMITKVVNLGIGFVLAMGGIYMLACTITPAF